MQTVRLELSDHIIETAKTLAREGGVPLDEFLVGVVCERLAEFHAAEAGVSSRELDVLREGIRIGDESGPSISAARPFK